MRLAFRCIDCARLSGMPNEVRTYITQLPLPRGASRAEAVPAWSVLNGYVAGQILPEDGGGWLV
jgi:hypothetical protein